MRWRSASLTACSAALLLAGCGVGERLPVVTALRLSGLAGDVAAGRGCGRPLVAATIASINAGEVPPSLQEQLVGDANEVQATCSRDRARALAERLSP